MELFAQVFGWICIMASTIFFALTIKEVSKIYVKKAKEVPHRKQAHTLINEALKSGKYDVLHKNIWFHPEGAGETSLGVLLYLSSGVKVLFSTRRRSPFLALKGNEEILMDITNFRKNRNLILDFFIEEQDAQFAKARQKKKDEATALANQAFSLK